MQLYKKEGDKRLAQEAFDRARSIDPSLALPWAGMSADSYTRYSDIICQSIEYVSSYHHNTITIYPSLYVQGDQGGRSL